MDLRHHCVTPVEVYGRVPARDAALERPRKADQETILRAAAYRLARFDGTELEGWNQIERECMAETILEPLRGR